MRLTIVIPAYDELPNLQVLIPAIHTSTAPLDDVATTIIAVVRTECADEQVAAVEALGALAIRRQPTDSFGDAIRTGLVSCPAGTDLVVFMDADGSHDPVTLPRLIAEADRADVVISSRYVEGGSSDNGPVLRTMSRVLNAAYGLVLGLRVRDISTNYKLFHFAQVDGITLTCSNFDIVEELLFRVRQRVGPGLRVIEVPDRFHERAFGQTKRRLGPFVASYLATLLRLRLRG